MQLGGIGKRKGAESHHQHARLCIARTEEEVSIRPCFLDGVSSSLLVARRFGCTEKPATELKPFSNVCLSNFKSLSFCCFFSVFFTFFFVVVSIFFCVYFRRISSLLALAWSSIPLSGRRSPDEIPLPVRVCLLRRVSRQPAHKRSRSRCRAQSHSAQSLGCRLMRIYSGPRTIDASSFGRPKWLMHIALKT